MDESFHMSAIFDPENMNDDQVIRNVSGGIKTREQLASAASNGEIIDEIGVHIEDFLPINKIKAIIYPPRFIPAREVMVRTWGNESSNTIAEARKIPSYICMPQYENISELEDMIRQEQEKIDAEFIKAQERYKWLVESYEEDQRMSREVLAFEKEWSAYYFRQNPDKESRIEFEQFLIDRGKEDMAYRYRDGKIGARQMYTLPPDFPIKKSLELSDIFFRGHHIKLELLKQLKIETLVQIQKKIDS